MVGQLFHGSPVLYACGLAVGGKQDVSSLRFSLAGRRDAQEPAKAAAASGVFQRGERAAGLHRRNHRSQRPLADRGDGQGAGESNRHGDGRTGRGIPGAAAGRPGAVAALFRRARGAGHAWRERTAGGTPASADARHELAYTHDHGKLPDPTGTGEVKRSLVDWSWVTGEEEETLDAKTRREH